jgi:hypothetical protein
MPGEVSESVKVQPASRDIACTRSRFGPCGTMANIREAGWAPSENLRREESSRANREDIAFHLSPTIPI